MEPAAVEVEVETDRPDPANGAATVTVVPIDDSLPPQADLGDALAAVPGAVVRRLGGLGAWSSVALRGSTARQVEVQVDGIPMNPDGVGAVDLSELPLWAFDRIEVWRSDPPLALGPGGIGGIVDLQSRPDDREEAAIAGGSYGTSTGRIAVGRAGRTSGLVLADGFATSGGFRYLADGGTPFTRADDRLLSRENADVRQLAVHGLVRRTGAVEWTVLDSLVARDQGVPGFTFALSPDARYSAIRDLLGASATSVRGAVRATATGWAIARSERFDDPSGLVGPGAGTAVGDTASGGARIALDAAPRGWVHASAAIEGHGDEWSDLVDAARVRGVGRLGGAVALSSPTWLLAPTAWVQWIDDADVAAGQASQVDVLPRLGARWSPDAATWVHASIGRSVRAPDLDELFGDRGAFVGNSDLRPEDAWTVDLGARVDGDAGSAELTGYWSEVRGLIAYVQNAQQIARPINLDAATIRGVEAGGSLGWRGVSVRASGSLADGVNRSDEPAYAGNALPRLPAWQLEVTASARRGPVQLGYDGSFSAGDWLDQANFARSPPRLLHGLFARVGGPSLAATLDVRNVGNQIVAVGPRNPLVDDGFRAVRAVTDFTGYPLPGRTVLVGLSWSGR